MAMVAFSPPCPLSGPRLSHLLNGIMKLEVLLPGYLAFLVSSLPYEADTPYVLRQGPHLPRFTDEEIEAQIRFSLPPGHADLLSPKFHRSILSNQPCLLHTYPIFKGEYFSSTPSSSR